MKIEFLGNELYFKYLDRDINNPDTISMQFTIAYATEVLYRLENNMRLVQLFENDESFGITNVQCNIDLMWLFNLQRNFGDKSIKFKFFLNLNPYDKNEYELLHTKLVLFKRADNDYVIYIGSHNWSNRAFGLGSPRNMEGSIRIQGNVNELNENNNLLQNIINHLNDAWNLVSCIPAIESNEKIYREWKKLVCKKETKEPGISNQEILFMNLVLDGEGISQITSNSIYLAEYESSVGEVLNRHQNVLLFVWSSVEDLELGQEPKLFFSEITTKNQTLASGSQNIAEKPIDGFRFWTNRFQQVKIERFNLALNFWHVKYSQYELDNISIDSQDKNLPMFRFLIEKIEEVSSTGEILFSQNKYVQEVPLDGIEVGRSARSADEILLEYKTVFGIAKPQVNVVTEHLNKASGLKLYASPFNSFFVENNVIDNPDNYYFESSLGKEKIAKNIYTDNKMRSLKRFGVVHFPSGRLKLKSS
ncbi:MAG: hypothetical protein R2794_01210 [Chitinophagales bacterium]